jgi:hypothetical protein
MADIRIKDLTTTASSTASDDFFAADGATNGTRKLSAYNPSFGGNATVGGTLTVNSTFASSASSTTLTSQFANTLTGAANILNLQLRRGDSANGFSRLMWGTGATTEWSLGSRSGDTNIYLWDEVANAERFKVSSSTGNVSIAATTASTATSSGALVVGNGTSGGLGVGGAIYAGGNLLITGTGKIGAVTAADSRFHVYESSAVDVGNGVTIEQAGTGDAVTAFLLTGVQRWSVGIDNSDSDKFKIGTGALGSADRLTIDTSGNTTVGGTLTVSGTGTSTVSGNLLRDGAAGAVRGYYLSTGGLARWGIAANETAESGSNAGSNFQIFSFDDAGNILTRPIFSITRSTGASAFAGSLTVSSTTASTSTSSGALVVSGGVGVAKRIYSGEGLNTEGDNSTHISFVRNGTVSIGPDSAATPALVVSTAIKTSAPSGGTAANWKLGTVATVSPTSPNRTIEVEIGGTTYYLHAKTTNN